LQSTGNRCNGSTVQGNRWKGSPVTPVIAPSVTGPVAVVPVMAHLCKVPVTVVMAQLSKITIVMAHVCKIIVVTTHLCKVTVETAHLCKVTGVTARLCKVTAVKAVVR
jgi:hypothetical protein